MKTPTELHNIYVDDVVKNLFWMISPKCIGLGDDCRRLYNFKGFYIKIISGSLESRRIYFLKVITPCLLAQSHQNGLQKVQGKNKTIKLHRMSPTAGLRSSSSSSNQSTESKMKMLAQCKKMAFAWHLNSVSMQGEDA